MFICFVGQTCLHLAAENTHLPIIRLLVMSGANLNTQVRQQNSLSDTMQTYWPIKKALPSNERFMRSGVTFIMDMLIYTCVVFPLLTEHQLTPSTIYVRILWLEQENFINYIILFSFPGWKKWQDCHPLRCRNREHSIAGFLAAIWHHQHSFQNIQWTHGHHVSWWSKLSWHCASIAEIRGVAGECCFRWLFR